MQKTNKVVSQKTPFLLYIVPTGDSICIDTNADDKIIYLNHDNHFERVHMNESLFKFALPATIWAVYEVDYRLFG